MFLYQVHILPEHLDIYGHLNNAVYFMLYEQARWEWITQNDYSRETVKTLQQGPVILEAHCRFIHEIRQGDVITIETECTEIQKATQVVKQRMINQNQRVCSEASFTFCLFDMKRRRLIPPTSAWMKALGRP